MIMQVQQFDPQTLRVSSPLLCHFLSSQKQRHYHRVQQARQTESFQQAVSSNVPESNDIRIHGYSNHQGSDHFLPFFYYRNSRNFGLLFSIFNFKSRKITLVVASHDFKFGCFCMVTQFASCCIRLNLRGLWRDLYF